MFSVIVINWFKTLAIDSQCDADAEWPGMMRGEEDEREGVWKGRERMKKGEREREIGKQWVWFSILIFLKLVSWHGIVESEIY